MSIAYDELRQRLAPNQGDWLQKSLDVSGVKASEIAEMLEVSPRTMSNYLAGRTHPKRRDLREWAIRTGVPLEYLETGIIPESPDGDDGSRLGESNSRPIHYE